MVRKTSHRGVHSGNTLRAFNSRFSRRYHNQACIVARVGTELLHTLQEQKPTPPPPAAAQPSAEEKVKKPAPLGNVAVDVALSLNKQARWSLPSSLIQQIKTDNIADSKLTVSMLERHKLKRPASCVSFHSNKGEVKRIQPQNGRYFSFAFPSVDGKSKRALRRERKEQMIETFRNRDNVKKQVTTGKMVEVFTELGKVKTDWEIGESEVRYEVFYPTPASSSIAHNPKYIKQDTQPAAGDGGINEHAQHGKPRKQHRGKQRKRMTLKDVDDWELAACYHHHLSEPQQNLTSVSRLLDPEEFATLRDHVGHQDQDEKQRRLRGSSATEVTECLLDSLLEKARHVQSFKGTGVSRAAKPRCKKNRTSSCLKEDDVVDEGHDKSHIVYLNDSTREEDFFVKDQKSGGHSVAEPSTTPPPIHSASPPPVPSDCTRVLLPKDDVSSASLRECFGEECYFEVGCKPRKFILDVTSNVREVLKKQGVQAKVAEQTEDALTFLICIHDGFYNDEYDVYRVLLNSKLHEGLLSVEISSQDPGQQHDLFTGTVMNLISHTMDFVQGLVADFKDKKRFPLFVPDTKLKTSHPRHLSNHLGSSEVYVPSVKRSLLRGYGSGSDVITTTTMPSLSDLMQQEEPLFCDVCYDDVSPLTNGSAPSTSLLSCQHRVCDACWSQHIHVRLHEGFARFTCPGYDCQREVKAELLLTVAPMNTVDTLLQRQEEVRIGSSQTEKWCPNEFCGRVISLKPSSLPPSSSSSSTSSLSSSSSSPASTSSMPFSSSGGSGSSLLQFQQDVVCACGTHICFHCLQPAHWPASCKQADDYRTSVATTVFPDRLAEVHDDAKIEELARIQRKAQEKQTMLVEGKYCPKCRSFVFKNGGCPQMTCRCGQLFCWYCAKPGYAHYSRHGCITEEQERKLTTTVVVHHLKNEEAHDNGAKSQQQQPSSGNRRQRVSLMERAVEHRHHRTEKNQKNAHAISALTRAVTSAAAKDKALAQHLTGVCLGAFPASLSPGTEPSSTPPPKSTSMLEMTSAFLRSADRSRRELLEVIEYSLVLLKDLPDSLLRRRALRISEDLSAFCSFSQSIFDVWGKAQASQAPLQEAVKALMRLAEIQDWVNAAVDTHVITIKKLRGLSFPGQ